MSSKFRIISMFVLIILVLQTFSIGVQAQSSEVISHSVSPAEQRRALKFWTRDTIANAQAFPMQVDLSSPDSSIDNISTPENVGPAASSPAGSAARNADQIAKAAYPVDWNAANQVDAESNGSISPEGTSPEGTSQVYDYYSINSWVSTQRIYPHKWVGRLSFMTTAGTSYCSATAISGNNFVTAAHCVYDTTNNVWYSNWVFTPAYRAGSAPYGTFAVTYCSILSSWQNLSGSFSINDWTKYDLAVCTVGNNSAGQTLNSAVGFAGQSWNYGYVTHRFSMGYPWTNYNYTLISSAGYYLRTCAAETFQQATDTLGMGCYYGGGHSGGPWFMNYKQYVAGSYVNSVNSGIYIGIQNTYGIRFTDLNIVPLCTARGCY